ncbi:MAG: DUF2809 domain-containing protein [Planctomycetota bacterium]|nr:DUF2809 domain-containing protein [Planctomycetota bacterium]
MQPTPPRNRLHYFALALLVIALGITLRSPLFTWLPFIPKYGGDALWAMMFFLLIGAIFPRASAARVALAAVAVSLAIEFFKLYHQPDLDRFRETLAGRLTLGKNFSWGGIAAYVLGAVVAAGAEWGVRRPPATKSGPQT